MGLPKLKRINPPEDIGGGLERYAEIMDGTGASAYRFKQPKEKKMVAKSKKSKTKTPTVRSRKGMRGGSVAGAPRVCGVCRKSGHNSRSHEPGGKLAKGR
jgi:hypothetical protein